MVESAGPAGKGIPVDQLKRLRRPVLQRMPEARFREMQEQFARIGLEPQPPRVTAESLGNVARAVFRLDDRIVATHWRDDLTEIADPALNGAFDIIALQEEADRLGLSGSGRTDWLVNAMQDALNRTASDRGLGGPVAVERFEDAATAPTWRDYLEGALFSTADYEAGRRAMRVEPPDPAAAHSGSRIANLYLLNQVEWPEA